MPRFPTDISPLHSSFTLHVLASHVLDRYLFLCAKVIRGDSVLCFTPSSVDRGLGLCHLCLSIICYYSWRCSKLNTALVGSRSLSRSHNALSIALFWTYGTDSKSLPDGNTFLRAPGIRFFNSRHWFHKWNHGVFFSSRCFQIETLDFEGWWWWLRLLQIQWDHGERHFLP